MTLKPPKHPLKLRSVFISDLHLGSRSCRIDYLHDFLKQVDTEYLYLVGDIVDLWSMKRSFFWPQEHNNVLRLILSKAKRGTKVIYIPGNHDEMFRAYVGHNFGRLHVKRDAVHTTADGRKLLILHGDEFDSAIQCGAVVELLGHHVYELLLSLNRRLNWLRQRLNLPYWSLATYLKHKANSAVNHIAQFEHFAVQAAQRRGLDGVLCGHIHHAKIATVDGLHYLNTGDWVESCTTIVEDQFGKMTLLHWSTHQQVMTGTLVEALINDALGTAA